MSTQTLSQRLRELHGRMTAWEHFSQTDQDLFHAAIAQAEAMEGRAMPTNEQLHTALDTMPDYNKHLGQAGGLSDTEGHLPEGVTPYDDIAHYIAQGVDHLTPCKEDEDGDIVESPAYQERVDDLSAILPYAFEYARKSGYLRPSQAIGEQTPVAWMRDDAPSQDAFIFHSPTEPLNPFFPIPLYRSPISPEARDRAIEAVNELIRTHNGFHEAIKYHTGLPYPWEPWNAAIDKWDQALSALRGS